MPVLVKKTKDAEDLSVHVDVEHLVSEIKERLCLRHHDRYYHRHPSSASTQRAMPYPKDYGGRHKCSRQNPSPNFSVASNNEATCSHNVHRSCGSSCSRDRKSCCRNNEDPHTLLQRLLAEQSLIQEAVRRLDSQFIDLKSCKMQKCSTKEIPQSRKVFVFMDEDSSDISSPPLLSLDLSSPSVSASDDDSFSTFQ